MVDFKLRVGFCFEGQNYKPGDVIKVTEHQAKLYQYAGDIVEIKEDGKKTERAAKPRRAKRPSVGSEHGE